MALHRPTAAALAALILTVAGSAHAASTAQLRTISAQANWSTVPDEAPLRYVDLFNNGDAQTGASYFGGFVPPANLYTVSGTTTGAETTPGDLTVDGQPLGLFTFSQANAAASALLDVNGTLFNNQSHFLRMNGPTTAGGAATTLFASNRSNFAVSSAWNFTAPDLGMRYGMRLTDANIGADGFDDLISLDVIQGGSGPQLQLRRVAGSELTGARSITEVENRSFESGLLAGYSLADIDLIAMHMYWFAGSKEVEAEVELLSTDGGIGLIGTVSFNNRYDIFNGPDTFTRFQVGAQWAEQVTAPVPEPSTYALMALGLAVVAGAARRRHKV